MPLQILSATPPIELLGAILTMIALGAYHGLNPGMGWLFALSLGLQRQSAKAIWVSLLPIATGHALSLLAVAVVVIAGAQFLSTQYLELGTAVILISFGLYKVFNYYRHPRWVGMQVGMKDLAWWSFLMATAHGAGLMIAPIVLQIAKPAESTQPMMDASGTHAGHAAGIRTAWEVSFGVLGHTVAMLVVMALVALVVYKKFGLSILRSHWINFDLIWAAALLIVGTIALLVGVGVV